MWYKSDFLKRANVEQKLLYDSVVSSFNPTTIVPVYFHAGLAASEYLIADVNKLYLAFSLQFCGSVLSVAVPQIIFRSPADVYLASASNASVFLNGAAVNYFPNIMILDNVSFGRIDPISYGEMKFIGFKLTK